MGSDTYESHEARVSLCASFMYGKAATHNTIFLRKKTTADLIAISFSTKRIILSEKMKVSANNETNLL